jgi:hypothetical protein
LLSPLRGLLRRRRGYYRRKKNKKDGESVPEILRRFL